jgi:hypothetical protein
VVLVVPATVLWLRRVGGRIGLWVPWMHLLAQTAAVAVPVAGGQVADAQTLAGILFGVFVVEALVVGSAATVLVDHRWAAVSSALLAGSYAALAVWLGWGPGTVALVTGVAGVVLVVPATVLWLRRVGGRIGLWVPWMHLLAQTAAVGAIASAAEVMSIGSVLWISAAACAADAVVAAVVAHTLPEMEMPLLSAGLAVGAAVLALAAVGDAQAAFTVHALVLGCGAAAGLASLSRVPGEWALPLWIAAVGFGAVACAFTLAVFGPVADETAAALFIAGAAMIALGIRAGAWWLLQAGTLVWLGPVGIVAHRALDGNPHGYVVGAAALCLAVLEMERVRRGDAGLPLPDEVRYAEWALMLVPLGLAAIDTVTQSSTYGLLMAAEGAAVLGWALVTQVRRRLVAGAGGIVLAIVLVVAVVAVQSTARGLPTGTWLAIGAVLAILLIAIGSLLERNRARLGHVIGQITQSLEDWR